MKGLGAEDFVGTITRDQWREANSQPAAEPVPPAPRTRPCRNCDAPFVPKRSNQRYCTTACRDGKNRCRADDRLLEQAVLDRLPDRTLEWISTIIARLAEKPAGIEVDIDEITIRIRVRN